MRKPLRDTTVKGDQRMKVALGRAVTATPVDQDEALEARLSRVESDPRMLEARLSRVESVGHDLEARLAHVETQLAAELDRGDQLEQRLTDAFAHSAQQLKSQDARMRSIQLGELERVDNLETELRNVRAGAAQQLDRIRALEGALERAEETGAAVPSDFAKVSSSGC